MNSYLQLLRYIRDNGDKHRDRTGTGTTSVFGYQFKHDLNLGFPLLTTKRVSFRNIAVELLWMLSGSTNIKPLQDQGVRIWNEWANPDDGDLGRVYGAQWRDFGGDQYYREGFDQLRELVQEARRNPNSRRLIVTAWHPEDANDVAARNSLPPCHCFFQIKITEHNKRLHLHMYQRSADSFLGVPYNIASYALLIHILARCVGVFPGVLTISYGDLHIYDNHREQVDEQLTRCPLDLPRLSINDLREPGDVMPWEFTPEDFRLSGYAHHSAIKAPVAV